MHTIEHDIFANANLAINMSFPNNNPINTNNHMEEDDDHLTPTTPRPSSPTPSFRLPMTPLRTRLTRRDEETPSCARRLDLEYETTEPSTPHPLRHRSHARGSDMHIDREREHDREHLSRSLLFDEEETVRLSDESEDEKMKDADPVIIETPTIDDDSECLCDVVFSFDTTGSMRSVLQSVKDNLTSTVDRLFEEVPGIRIGIIAHGDYNDYPQMMWKINPTKDKIAIKNLIIAAKDTCGGDSPECYEYVLHTARSIPWKSDVRVLVMIGDESPHEKDYHMPKRIPGFQRDLHIDWNLEVQALKEMNVTIFSCHADNYPSPDSKHFYHTISNTTGGYYFTLENLTAFPQYMVAICLRSADGAETVRLLEERKRELEKEIEDIKNNVIKVDHKTAAERLSELEEVRSAARDVSGGRLFSSPCVHTSAARIRREKGYSSRMERYESEIRSRRDVDVSTIDFVTSVSQPVSHPEDNPEVQPTPPRIPRRTRSLKKRESE